MSNVFIVLLLDEDGNTHGVHSVWNTQEAADDAAKEVESSTEFITEIQEHEVQ